MLEVPDVDSIRPVKMCFFALFYYRWDLVLW